MEFSSRRAIVFAEQGAAAEGPKGGGTKQQERRSRQLNERTRLVLRSTKYALAEAAASALASFVRMWRRVEEAVVGDRDGIDDGDDDGEWNDPAEDDEDEDG